MLGNPGTFFSISSQGDFWKKLFNLVCAVSSVPWCSLRGQVEKDNGAAPVTLCPRLLFSGWVRTKTLFWFPDQRLKLCSLQASQIQSPTWGGQWPPDSTVWVADTDLSLQQRQEMEIPAGTCQQLPQEQGLSPATLQLLTFGQLQIKRKCPIEGLISVD